MPTRVRRRAVTGASALTAPYDDVDYDALPPGLDPRAIGSPPNVAADARGKATAPLTGQSLLKGPKPMVEQDHQVASSSSGRPATLGAKRKRPYTQQTDEMRQCLDAGSDRVRLFRISRENQTSVESPADGAPQTFTPERSPVHSKSGPVLEKEDGATHTSSSVPLKNPANQHNEKPIEKQLGAKIEFKDEVDTDDEGLQLGQVCPASMKERTPSLNASRSDATKRKPCENAAPNFATANGEIASQMRGQQLFVAPMLHQQIAAMPPSLLAMNTAGFPFLSINHCFVGNNTNIVAPMPYAVSQWPMASRSHALYSGQPFHLWPASQQSVGIVPTPPPVALSILDGTVSQQAMQLMTYGSKLPPLNAPWKPKSKLPVCICTHGECRSIAKIWVEEFGSRSVCIPRYAIETIRTRLGTYRKTKVIQPWHFAGEDRHLLKAPHRRRFRQLDDPTRVVEPTTTIDEQQRETKLLQAIKKADPDYFEANIRRHVIGEVSPGISLTQLEEMHRRLTAIATESPESTNGNASSELQQLENMH